MHSSANHTKNHRISNKLTNEYEPINKMSLIANYNVFNKVTSRNSRRKRVAHFIWLSEVQLEDSMVFKSLKELKDLNNFKMFFNFYPKNIHNVRKGTKSNIKQYKLDIVWFNVIALSILHIIAIYGLYLWLIAWKCQFYSMIFRKYLKSS